MSEMLHRPTTPPDVPPARMRRLRRPFRIVRANLGAYLALNVIMYGALLVGMGAAMIDPELSAASYASQQQDGTVDLVTSLLGSVWLFSLTILAVNTLTVGLLTILLPSLIVPFAGIALAAYRSFGFGVALAPIDDTTATILLPHSLTILIELQAYVLLMLGSYLIGRYWLRPAAIGAPTRRRGYIRGLAQFGWLSLPALALFVIGALYEAFEIIYLVPPLLAG